MEKELPIPQKKFIPVLARHGRSANRTFDLHVVRKRFFGIHLDKTRLVDIMSAMQLGMIDLIETNRTCGYGGGMLVGDPILVHDTHRIAFIAQGVGSGHDGKTLGTKGYGPQQFKKGAENVRYIFRVF